MLTSNNQDQKLGETVELTHQNAKRRESPKRLCAVGFNKRRVTGHRNSTERRQGRHHLLLRLIAHEIYFDCAFFVFHLAVSKSHFAFNAFELSVSTDLLPLRQRRLAVPRTILKGAIPERETRFTLPPLGRLWAGSCPEGVDDGCLLESREP